jgi:membrane protease YdiL (CAAX protease family)
VRFLGALTAQRVPISRIRIDAPARETRLVLGYSLFYIGAAIVIGLLIRHFPMPLWGASEFLQDFWYSCVFKIGLLLIVPMIAFRRLGYRANDLLFGWRLTPRTALSLVIAFVGGNALNVGRLASLRAAADALPTWEAALRIALGLSLAFLQAGLPEEFVYRGLLQTRLERTTNRVVAILGTALLFTAWHLPTRFLLAHGIEGEAGHAVSVLLGTGAPVFLVGLALGLAWDRWRNLPVLIAVHTGIDTIPITSSMLQVPPF